MIEVGVRELRANLAAALRLAGEGERVLVTSDGHPLAQLGPVTAGGAPTLRDLEAAGLIDGPSAPRPPPPSLADLAVDVRVDRALDDLRGP